MKKRQKFNCWNCHRNFSLLLEITDQQTLIMPCPFCAAECVAELTPHYKKETMRGGIASATPRTSSPQGNDMEELDLPDVLPTQQKT